MCAKCGQQHHTSICDRAAQLMTPTSSRNDAVVYAVVVVEVEGVNAEHCWIRALGVHMR